MDAFRFSPIIHERPGAMCVHRQYELGGNKQEEVMTGQLCDLDTFKMNGLRDFNADSEGPGVALERNEDIFKRGTQKTPHAHHSTVDHNHTAHNHTQHTHTQQVKKVGTASTLRLLLLRNFKLG
jgi:hypothetical protein